MAEKKNDGTVYVVERRDKVGDFEGWHEVGTTKAKQKRQAILAVAGENNGRYRAIAQSAMSGEVEIKVENKPVVTIQEFDSAGRAVEADEAEDSA